MPPKKQQTRKAWQPSDRILGRDPYTVTPGSGLVVTDEMKSILASAQSGYIKSKEGGDRLRTLYIDHSIGFQAMSDLSPFGRMCYFGSLQEVIKAVTMGWAPVLDATETPYRAGYATIVVWGSQRVQGIDSTPQHLEVLKYLISRGLPLDIPDICHFTSVHHFMMNQLHDSRQIEILRLLLDSGANPNARDIYGTPPMVPAFQQNYAEGIELLMDFGADLEIEDADGCRPSKIYIPHGPKVAAAVQKGLRKRNGENLPREEKRCDGCLITERPLKNCARCHVARYCSVECQKKHWSTHKKVCQAFVQSDTVTVKPYCETKMPIKSTSDYAREFLGYQTESIVRSAKISKKLINEQKPLVIKVQIPDSPVFEPKGSILIYTKKRDEFMCFVRRIDDSKAYDTLHQAVKTKGVGGLKAYFSATLRSESELVVKISEVLAPQPF